MTRSDKFRLRFHAIQGFTLTLGGIGLLAGLLVGFLFGSPETGIVIGFLVGALPGLLTGVTVAVRIDRDSKLQSPPPNGWRRWDDDDD